jgi:hypothetical protein
MAVLTRRRIFQKVASSIVGLLLRTHALGEVDCPSDLLPTPDRRDLLLWQVIVSATRCKLGTRLNTVPLCKLKNGARRYRAFRKYYALEWILLLEKMFSLDAWTGRPLAPGQRHPYLGVLSGNGFDSELFARRVLLVQDVGAYLEHVLGVPILVPPTLGRFTIELANSDFAELLTSDRRYGTTLLSKCEHRLATFHPDGQRLAPSDRRQVCLLKSRCLGYLASVNPTSSPQFFSLTSCGAFQNIHVV